MQYGGDLRRPVELLQVAVDILVGNEWRIGQAIQSQYGEAEHVAGFALCSVVGLRGSVRLRTKTSHRQARRDVGPQF